MPHTLESLFDISRRAVATAIAEAIASASVNAYTTPVICIDGTAGNGHDTLFMASLLQGYSQASSQVLAFDVQEAALTATHARLQKHGITNAAKLILASHASLAEYIPHGTKICAAMFNFGYLPGGSHSMTTNKESSLKAINALLALLQKGGVISLHCYTGQAGGKEEEEAIKTLVQGLKWDEWHCAAYSFCNKEQNRETLFLLEKI